MDINNYNIKIDKNQKKGKKIFGANSTYLFYIFWIIKDAVLKQQKNSKKGLLDLDIRKIYEKLKNTWMYDWNLSVIYKVVNFLIQEKIIEVQKISNKLLIINMINFKKYYIPKKILDLVIKNQKLVPANYLRIYQYLKNLAISNFKSSRNTNLIFESENSYSYFQNLDLDTETIAAGLKWIKDNNLKVEFENKTLSKDFISHINLAKNKFFKGLKYQKEQVSIELIRIIHILNKQKIANKTYFYSKVKFIWKVSKRIISKIKKFFEYLIKRPCYSLKKVKSGWNYANCWCKNKGQHWSINQENPKYKSYYRDKNTIIRRLGQSFESWLYGRLKHIKSSWFLNLKIIH